MKGNDLDFDELDKMTMEDAMEGLAIHSFFYGAADLMSCQNLGEVSQPFFTI